MKIAAFLGILVFCAAHTCFAGDAAPDCLNNDGTALAVMDQQVIQWKTSTPNQWRARARVEGTVDQVFPDATGHHHFEIKIGPDDQDTLEVVYNEGFGATPSIQLGDTVEACGDYITSYAQGGGYPPSPSGALIHWVHRSNNPQRHPSGYLMVNGILYGAPNH